MNKIDLDLTSLINVSWMAWSQGWLAAEELHGKYPDENKPHPYSKKMMDDFYDTMLSKNDDKYFSLYNQFIQILIDRGYISKGKLEDGMMVLDNIT